MNRFLQIFNLLGVLCLAALLAIQWNVNSQANHRAIALEIVRQQQQVKLQEDDNTIKGCQADLDEFRLRLTLAESQLKDLDGKLHKLKIERDQIAAERDQLAVALPKWKAAVAQRDGLIKQASTEMQKLADDRNNSISKYNDLVAKYNVLVRGKQ